MLFPFLSLLLVEFAWAGQGGVVGVGKGKSEGGGERREMTEDPKAQSTS